MVNLKKLKFWGGNEIIKFYCVEELDGILLEPKPAVKYLPDWFKCISPSIPEARDDFGAPSMTAKKCFPMIDAMSLGYVIPTSGDIRVVTNNDCSEIEVYNPPKLRCAEFHSIEQIGGQTAPGFPAKPVKFINWWIIKTAPGWSTLFIPPINHFNPLFTCLGGLVDTDTYPKEVNFPAVWHRDNYDGTILAGTPLVTAIPIKRESFPKKPIITKITKAENKELERIQRVQGSRSHYYTQTLRCKER
jgi:hypothetical protein